MRKSSLSFSNISTIALVIFALLMLFSPESKGLVINGLMKIGLFQADFKETDAPQHSTYALSNISFKDSNGKEVSIASLKGKVLLVNFWATWCPPCRAEMPSIESLYQKFKGNDQVAFLMVDVDGNSKTAKKSMDKKKYSLPVFTPASSIPESLMSGSIPTTLIINKKGELVYRHEGAADFSSEKVVDYFRMLLKE
ncbi:TlpA family protein disulfide reductase [Desertivirga xinjiangensis]|uniref:TlpA family protein disulfide reductase n=1 Tax=Desertivirga xinjiangensis TaxID=539206 RepID=UPI00210896A1|nr:TlpA disulfide reductase family protein [Pedobacter xinjiangensis]